MGDDIDKLARLYGEMESKQTTLAMHAMRHVGGLKPHDRVAADLAYRRAAVEYDVALNAYNSALAAVSAKSEPTHAD